MKDINKLTSIIEKLISTGAIKSEKQLAKMGINKVCDICIDNNVDIRDVLCYFCSKEGIDCKCKECKRKNS